MFFLLHAFQEVCNTLRPIMITFCSINYDNTFFEIQCDEIYSMFIERYCQCLGSLNVEQSLGLLDMYCRINQFTIADSFAKNATGSPLKQIIPYKRRCGSMNPYMMYPNDKCYCDEDAVSNTTKPGEPTKGMT